MATIREKFLLVANFEQSQEKIMSDVITDTSETILDANREQMLSGRYKDGTKITPEYAKKTKKKKKKQGRDPEKVSLFDTGDFHSAMFLEQKGESIIIDSKDEKTEKLMGRYNKNDNLLGIPMIKRESINESIMDKFINIFRLMTKL